MKTLQFVSAVAISFCLFGCNSNKESKSASQEKDNKEDSLRHLAINKVAISNAEDPVCNMSLIRGFDDTTLYKGQVIGFCSKDCKDEFLKNPSSYNIKSK